MIAIHLELLAIICYQRLHEIQLQNVIQLHNNLLVMLELAIFLDL
jgi:hypothetical protein